MSFFFSKQNAKKFSDVNILRQLECRVCPLYTLISNQNKDIKPSGNIKPEVYILGSSTTEIEDEKGEFFSGPDGRFLKSALTAYQAQQARFNKIARTRDPNERPSFEAIECCRPSIERDIVETKPKLILGFGQDALNWALGNNTQSLEAWRGKHFPITIMGHTTWFLPMYDPQYVQDHPFLTHVFKLDITNAYKFLERKLIPEVENKKLVYENTEILDNLKAIRYALFEVLAKKPFAYIDLETNKDRPYYTGSKILTCAVGCPEYSIAFALEHPQAKWTPAELAELKAMLYEFICLPQVKAAHNAAFELEWLINEYDANFLKFAKWEDTMAAGYCLEGKTTKVLMADLSWKLLKDIQIGDKILTPEENPTRTKSRKWKIATVTNKIESIKPSYKISSPEGELTGSKEHKLLLDIRSKSNKDKQWRGWGTIEDVLNTINKKAINLRFFAKPWEAIKDYEVGWLSGIFDGEGSFSGTEKHGGITLDYTQNKGDVTTKANTLISKLGFSRRESKRTERDCYSNIINGGFNKIAEFLGKIRPERLISKLENIINNVQITTQKNTKLSRISTIEYVGEKEVVDITTTEGTFIANGFIVHNCLGLGGKSKDKGEGDESVQRGLLALDNMTMLYFGFFLKNISHLNRANLANEPLQSVLLYNVLDVKYGSKLLVKVREDIKHEKLDSAYAEQNRRIPTMVLTQKKGLPYDEPVVQAYWDDFSNKAQKSIEECLNNQQIIEYQTKFGKFDLNSAKDCAMFFKWLGYNEVNVPDEKDKKKTKLSSDEEVLNKIITNHGHPVAKNLLVMREVNKVKSTYIEPFIKKTIVFPDGKLHTQFTTMFTTTGRTSSKDPNVQNFPKRKNKDVRKIIIPPPGFLFCSNDYGQIEARVLAMASKDPKFVEALWTGFDIHADWALRLAKLYPKRVGGNSVVYKWEAADIQTLRNTDKLFKAFRDIVKNKWVFPSFFGASTKSLSGYMDIPVEFCQTGHEEFWDEFQVIRAWQDTMYDFYNKKGYIESLTGRRRYAYMQGGEIINHPIQSTACDIVLDGMNRLSEYALETGLDQFQANINVHDDLGFFLNKETWKEDLKIIIKEMLSCKFGFINVPLTVESAIGPNWYENKEVGTFASNKMEEIELKLAP